MRLGYAILATVTALLASGNFEMIAATKAKSAMTDSISNPHEGKTGENDKAGIFHHSESDEISPAKVHGKPIFKPNIRADDQEERGLPISNAATKLKKQAGEAWNNVLWHIFHKMTAEKYRIG